MGRTVYQETGMGNNSNLKWDEPAPVSIIRTWPFDGPQVERLSEDDGLVGSSKPRDGSYLWKWWYATNLAVIKFIIVTWMSNLYLDCLKINIVKYNNLIGTGKEFKKEEVLNML